MKLYSYYRSSASYRVRIALNVKGIAWEYIPVALDKGEQFQREHIARNPMQLVPVLDTGDSLLAQSVAIIEYLEALFPNPAMLPADEIDKARVRDMVQIIASEIQPIANLRVLKHVRDSYAVDDDGVGDWARHWIAHGFEAFEARTHQYSTSARFSFGDSLTFADAFLMPQAYNADRFGLDMTPYPTIRSIIEHCSTIDTVSAAHPSQQPDAPA